MNNLIKIIKVIACEKSSKTNYYRVAVWEGEKCRHSLGLSRSIWHRKTQFARPLLRIWFLPPNLSSNSTASHLKVNFLLGSSHM